MKYQRLSKEQLEEFQQEFINFLATQSITADEWSTIKKQQPDVAEEELDVFSDLIWEGVLKKLDYVEHVSSNQLHLFYFSATVIKLISVKTNVVDLATADGFKWLFENINNEALSFFTANKNYSLDKHKDKFQLIQQGAVVSDGELYKTLAKIISK
jgi:hypothetical protein